MKFENDKYYTPKDVVERIVNLLISKVGDDFGLIIEPSAGDGSFIEKIKECFKGDKVFIDIEPEHEDVTVQDFLKYTPPYIKGKTLVIGNPPFGTRNTLSVKFFKRAVTFADVIGFIQPISQLENTQQMYEFNLLESIDLGEVNFHSVCGNVKKVHCCFNIYTKPVNGKFNEKKVYKFKEVKVVDFRKCKHSKRPLKEGDFVSIIAWGSVGKVCTPKTYAQELHIYSESKEILDFCKTFDWRSVCSKTASPSLYIWKVYEVLQNNFKLTREDK